MAVSIITGATSGIGKEFVLLLDRKLPSDDEIWMVARSETELQNISGKLKHSYRIFPMDLTEECNISEFISILEKERPTISFLINSAGYGVNGSLESLNAYNVSTMIDLNCRALTRLTQMCIPFIQKGHIIQLSSGSAFVPQPYFAVYAATKAYVLSFSKALHRELKSKGISVTAVCPGPVNTPFLDKAASHKKAPAYKKYFIASPKKVAQKAYNASLRNKNICVYGLSMKAIHLFSKLIPRDIIINITALLNDK